MNEEVFSDKRMTVQSSGHGGSNVEGLGGWPKGITMQTKARARTRKNAQSEGWKVADVACISQHIMS